MPGKKKTQEVKVDQMKWESIELAIVGISELILHAMPSKAKQELLYPSGPKSRSEKKLTMKHNPYLEFLECPYRFTDDNNPPTRFGFKCESMGKAIQCAALDIPTVAKTEIGRLSWVEGTLMPVWGIPEMMMTIVRQAGIAKTPDVRTRMVLRRWATKFKVSYLTPNLNQASMVNLVAAAGVTNGIGDWRRQKGGNFGMFKIVPPDDKEYLEIVKAGGREAQDDAIKMENLRFFDAETEELYRWFEDEREVRGRGDSSDGLVAKAGDKEAA